LKIYSDEIVRSLEGDNAPIDIPIKEWEAFRNLFRLHLEHFGHIIYNLDFAHPLPIDHPQPLLETVKMYLNGEGADPHERQHNSEEKREQAVRISLGKVKGLRRWMFQKSLGWAQSLSEIRESALADIGLGYPLLRQMLQELGRRFVRAGIIDQLEDIYWLTKEEVVGYLAVMESGEELENQDGEIQQRKVRRKALKKLTPPPILPPKERIMGFKTDDFVATSEGDQVGNTLKGVPASSGRVTSAACVLHGPEDFHQMKPGLVLVAATTTPAWTPLFAMASAVVTDIGGPLSHGSIVAREYGIPAVMGTGIATRRILNGQVITVDGDAGTILLEIE
jgi:phosphohistidine swiveling domain-containing protein